MSQILVRNLSPEVVERLKNRARLNRRSLEAEVREILDDAASRVSTGTVSPLLQKFRADIAAGRDRREAFSEYSRAIRETSKDDLIDSADVIRAEREERDARFE